MLSTSKKFALNKRTLNRKSVSSRQNEAFDKKSMSISRKNCFHCQELKKAKTKFRSTPKFKNGVHHQKKTLNKNTRLVVLRKSVSFRTNEGFVKKYDFTGPKNCFHLNQYRILLNICLHPISIIVSKKNMNEIVSFPLNRKSVATGCNKGLV